ncbi:NAD(P)H-dependent oxidoreductase [Thalassotalea ponticola]|uniref:NAD(P)H-dependent oxidoreductase n=1 Tax=Thalassotalea ponticola TaxID=1523392 RepID=UPI0025B607CF|nr:NAD(P)H-dependent oxidoreductase [Thalassotalea ponticola]MDN3653331.1 NAD(P)H-dependent oxidoreductase [Thalassotalea ponticola]
MNHPIITDLQQRYTAKRYDSSKRISHDKLDIIYEALRLSASSINSQPWKFIVIESDAAKQRMDSTFANMFQFNQPHIMAASHIILFAHNPKYSRDDFAKVIDKGIADGRTAKTDRDAAFAAFAFVELNTDSHGFNSEWTKAQTYIALGNCLHTLARLKIDSTTMEGIDSALIGEVFADELDGYVCNVALAIGYHHPTEDYNATLPKSRLDIDSVITII